MQQPANLALRRLTGARVIAPAPEPADDPPVAPILTLFPAQELKVRSAFLEGYAPEAIRRAWREVVSLRAERATLVEGFPTVMVMEEMPTPRESHILLRGSYMTPGEKVTPALPSFLSGTASAKTFRNDRLGLAQWLTDPSNPLLKDVLANNHPGQIRKASICRSFWIQNITTKPSTWRRSSPIRVRCFGG